MSMQSIKYEHDKTLQLLIVGQRFKKQIVDLVLVESILGWTTSR